MSFIICVYICPVLNQETGDLFVAKYTSKLEPRLAKIIFSIPVKVSNPCEIVEEADEPTTPVVNGVV